ncbi:glycine betaine ABC transporter substrate-binding protein [Oceanimonas sp. CHS3-5]|uniref:glycine betaine ABC transporter substrate-binding protein n=1 Tax=Oceanimonas sp. CHS3-5 TaxID=3068186 RepID=UPI00273F2428|nr:glycine betaine ABC transporter substrate-binding protein [Oceanimonas sp. CHS3-5]MDP5292554.1 glycine betaine ABC transporter substrate-binding protein [Oceanimonas sp. CHS3-5]
MKHRLLLMLALLLTACSPAEQQHIRLLSGDWDTARATTELARLELEQAGFAVTVEQVPPGQIWSRLASGEADASLSAWLPDSSRRHAERFFDKLHDLGPNGPVLKLGLAVPSSARLKRISELAGSDYGDHRVVGMMPGHGSLVLTEQALARYKLDDYRLLSGSGEAYRHLVNTAIEQQMPVVIAAWSPGSVMLNDKLKWLEDDNGFFASSERAHTLVRRGLEDSAPRAMEVLSQIRLTEQELTGLLQRVSAGQDLTLAVNQWRADMKATLNTASGGG